MTIEDLERRVRTLEEQVHSLLDQRRELGLIRVAVDNHTTRLAEHDVKLNILIETTSETRRLVIAQSGMLQAISKRLSNNDD